MAWIWTWIRMLGLDPDLDWGLDLWWQQQQRHGAVVGQHGVARTGAADAAAARCPLPKGQSGVNLPLPQQPHVLQPSVPATANRVCARSAGATRRTRRRHVPQAGGPGRGAGQGGQAGWPGELRAEVCCGPPPAHHRPLTLKRKLVWNKINSSH